VARAELSNSIRSGMAGELSPSTHQETGFRDQVVAAPGAVPEKPPSLRGRLFGRLADYARRYLTTSVEHRLTAVLTELDGLHRRLDQAAERSGRLEAALGVIGHQLGDTQDRLATLNERQAQFALFGPRFDELEVKLRPMIAFDDQSYAIRLRDGYAMVPRSEPVFAVMVANATSGGLEPGTRRVLQALLEPGMTAADVGANVGLLTLACAVSVGSAGKVYAFEPETGPRLQLNKTLQLNGLHWVEVSDCAVGALEERRTFHVSPVIGHSSLYKLPADEAGRGVDVEVQVRPLDDIIPPGQPLDVVKMDVEGAELDVLRGMQRLLSDNADIAVVAEYGPSHLERIGIAPADWFGAFEAAGFVGFEILEPTGACRPASADTLVAVASANIVFVRPAGSAYTRLPQ
jgi:FkbM family methyltransferase